MLIVIEDLKDFEKDKESPAHTTKKSVWVNDFEKDKESPTHTDILVVRILLTHETQFGRAGSFPGADRAGTL